MAEGVNWEALNRINALRTSGQALKMQQGIQKKENDRQVKQRLQLALLKNLRIKQGGNPGALVGDDGNVDFSQLENAPDPKNVSRTSVSIQERPLAEILSARDEMARTPDEWAKAGMGTILGRKKGTGFMGTGYGLGSQNEVRMSPEAEMIRSKAKQILANPNKVTKRVSNYAGDESTDLESSGSILGGGGSATSLPDVEEYEEGDVIQDDNGKNYELKDGEWMTK